MNCPVPGGKPARMAKLMSSSLNLTTVPPLSETTVLALSNRITCDTPPTHSRARASDARKVAMLRLTTNSTYVSLDHDIVSTKQ